MCQYFTDVPGQDQAVLLVQLMATSFLPTVGHCDYVTTSWSCLQTTW